MSTQLPTPRDQLFSVLNDLNIKTTTIEHPALFTVEDSKNLRGNIPGGHSKNLFLKSKDKRFWLISALEDTTIHLKTLAKATSAKTFSFAKPDILMEKLGLTPGSVSPFALINNIEKDITVILDKAFAEHEILNFHPLENTATTQITYPDLLKFVEAMQNTHFIHDFRA